MEFINREETGRNYITVEYPVKNTDYTKTLEASEGEKAYNWLIDVKSKEDFEEVMQELVNDFEIEEDADNYYLHIECDYDSKQYEEWEQEEQEAYSYYNYSRNY